jgi:hypothetical protein
VKKSEPRSISGLWNEAYDELRRDPKEKKTIEDYNSVLEQDMSAMIGATVSITGTSLINKQHEYVNSWGNQFSCPLPWFI